MRLPVNAVNDPENLCYHITSRHENSLKGILMKKAYVVIIALVMLISMVAVSLYYYLNRPTTSSEIRISTNPWVGFTPLIYAQEKGWLDDSPFKFIWLVDLTDNARLYRRGFTQGFTATQYELMHFKEQHAIKPVFLIDHSYGADAILSNRSLDELRSSKSPVKVFLERGSLNEDFFNAFVRENGLDPKIFSQIDSSQKNISAMPMLSEAVMLISYSPYLSELQKKGYRTVASTRTLKNFYVIDALFVDEKVIDGNEEEFARLKEIMVLAIKRFKQDPKEYYSVIKGYLEGQTYEEFIESTEGIEWLHDTVPPTIVEYLQSQKIKTDRLLP